MASESNPSVEALQLSKEEQAEAERLLGENFLGLTSDEQACLSKVLFPETDLDTIMFVGEKRTLQPLPLKISKQVYSLLEPFAKAHKAAETSREPVSLNDDIIFALLKFAECLATFYKWENALPLIKDEMVALPELQELAVKQQQKNGANDFLLASLRVLVNVMRLHEITNVKFHSMLTTPRSRRDLTARSMRSSQDTPADKLPL